MDSTVLLLPEFGRDLEKDIMSETSGHFRRLLVSCLQVRRHTCDLLVHVQVHIRVPHSSIGLFLLDLVQQKPQTCRYMSVLVSGQSL